MEDKEFLKGMSVGCVIMTVTLVAALFVQYRMWCKQAIEHGAASYVITDDKTRAVEFRWKENDHAAR